MEFLETAFVEPLGEGKKAFVLQENTVSFGYPFLEPQGSTADDVGRRHVLGKGKLGSLLERSYRGGVSGIDFYHLHAPFLGQGVNLLQ